MGYILPGDEIVEVENVSGNPENSFDVRGEDVLQYAFRAIATWHTHPGGSSNLSVDDYTAFRNYPHLKHYVIGDDGIACYAIKEGVILHDA